VCFALIFWGAAGLWDRGGTVDGHGLQHVQNIDRLAGSGTRVTGLLDRGYDIVEFCQEDSTKKWKL
jgi:hypothetical protein